MTAVCAYADLQPERGVAALVGERQVAVFRLHDGSVRAVDHRDPFSGANVMARGIVGTRGAVPTVASPMFKQVFDLVSGLCLDDATVSLRVFPVEVRGDVVHVLSPASPALSGSG
jgi:nitrite reductase (NADH) small subunit